MDTYEELTLFGDEFLISEPLDTTNAGSSSAEVSPYSPVFADEFVISRPLDTTNAGLSSAEVSPYSNDTLSEYASPESNSSIDWDFAPESDSSLVFDDPCIDEIPRTSAEGNNISAATDQTSAVHGYPSTTNSPTQQDDDGTSSGDSLDSDSGEDPSCLFPEDDTWLALAHAKHRMMVSLMRDFYAIFNSQWRVGFRSQTGSQSTSPDAYSQDSSSPPSSSTRSGKRPAQDGDSHSPDANEGKKRRANASKMGDNPQGRLYACCFYKYNPQKYCSSHDTGTKYRSCAGPGFSKISQLKQHLRRIHRAPIYCPRCWLVMDSQMEMTSHANAEDRCEREAPQALEGVDNDKMRMIADTWGITWEGIYEILFPDYETDEVVPEIVEPSSPQSEELRNFETYNRTALPLLVEANLRAIVESQIAPIEERVRAMIVDIVRTAQSTIARNFNSMNAPTSSADDETQPHSQTVRLAELGALSSEEPAQTFGIDGADHPSELYHEPPHLNAEASASFPDPVSIAIGSQYHSSDSGYSSLPFSCPCSCHGYSNTWNTANSHSSCQSCAFMHIELDDPNDLDPGNSRNNFDFDEDGTGP